jgi:selenocysteine lyase/cysteine desulfurase
MREQLYLKTIKSTRSCRQNIRKKYQVDSKNIGIVNDLNRVTLEIYTLKEDIEKFLNAEESPLHKNLEDWK